MRVLIAVVLLSILAFPTPAHAQLIPRDWDWRDVGGTNYVSGVRNMNACGS